MISIILCGSVYEIGEEKLGERVNKKTRFALKKIFSCCQCTFAVRARLVY